MFKKKSEAEIKQPQELYCANKKCLNEIARFHQLFHVLDVKESISNKYCFDCIVDSKIGAE